MIASGSGGPLRVALLTTAGNGNLGDEAILQALMAALRRRHPEATIAIYSGRPEDSARRYGVATGPIRPGRSVLGEIRFPLRVFRELRRFDAFLVAGGGQLDDYWGGPWSHPYTLMLWAEMSRVAKVPVAFLGVGVCAVRGRLSTLFLRRALDSAGYISLRDAGSHGIVQALGCRRPSVVVPDLAFGIELPGTAPARLRVVGISPMAYMDPRCWPEESEPRYRDYISRLASLAGWLDGRGYQIELFASQTRMDSLAVRDLLTAMDTPVRERTVVHEHSGVQDLLRALGGMQFVVASRLHGLLLATCAGRPVLALSYDRKVDAFAAEFGISQYCLGIDSFTAESIQAAFHSLEGNSRLLEQSLSEKVEECRAALERQYDALFGPAVARCASVAGTAETAMNTCH